MYLNVCLVTVSQCRFFSVLSKPFIVIEMVIIRTCDHLCLLVRSFYMLLVILAFFHLFCMLSCSVLMCMESIWWFLLRISKQTFQIQSKANSSTLYKIIKKVWAAEAQHLIEGHLCLTYIHFEPSFRNYSLWTKTGVLFF